MSPDEIVSAIEEMRVKENLPKDEKVKPLTQKEIASMRKLPEGWKWVLSNDISRFITNGVHTPTGKEDKNNYGLRCLRITDIKLDGTVDFSNLPYCHRIIEGDYEKTLKKNDIYISFTGSLLKKWYLVLEDNPGVVYAHYFVRWQPLVVDPRYIFYFLNGPDFAEFVYSHTLGSTQQNLKVTDLKRVPIPIPDMSTQTKIADILYNLDEKIRTNNQINTNLLDQAMLLYEKHFPYTVMDELPAGWRVGTVGEIVEIHDSKRIPLSGAQRSKMEKRDYPYYGAATLMDYVDDYIFDGKYLLLGEDGTVVDDAGYPILQYVWGKFWVNNHAHILTGKLGFNVESLLLLFKHTPVKSIVTGAVQAKISQANLRSVQIVIPPEVELIKFNEFICPMFDKIRQNEEQNRSLASIRDSLLPRLMTGELNVSDIDL